MTDLLVSRFELFAQQIKKVAFQREKEKSSFLNLLKEIDGGSLRSPEEQLADALSVFQAGDLV